MFAIRNLYRLKFVLGLTVSMVVGAATFFGAFESLWSDFEKFRCRFFGCENSAGLAPSSGATNDSIGPSMRIAPRIRVDTEVIYKRSKFIIWGGEPSCDDYAGFYVRRGDSFIQIGDNSVVKNGDYLYVYLSSKNLIVSPKLTLQTDSEQVETVAYNTIFERLPKTSLPASIQDACPSVDERGQKIYVKQSHVTIDDSMSGREYAVYYEAEDVLRVYPIHVRVE